MEKRKDKEYREGGRGRKGGREGEKEDNKRRERKNGEQGGNKRQGKREMRECQGRKNHRCPLMELSN